MDEKTDQDLIDEISVALDEDMGALRRLLRAVIINNLHIVERSRLETIHSIVTVKPEETPE